MKYEVVMKIVGMFVLCFALLAVLYTRIDIFSFILTVAMVLGIILILFDKKDFK